MIKVLPSSEILESEPHWGMEEAWACMFSSDPFSCVTLSKLFNLSEISIPNLSQSPPTPGIIIPGRGVLGSRENVCEVSRRLLALTKQL